MAGPYLAIFILINGIIAVTYSQQYDGDPNAEWQSGRLQRVKNPSLRSPTQSSQHGSRFSSTNNKNDPTFENPQYSLVPTAVPRGTYADGSRRGGRRKTTSGPSETHSVVEQVPRGSSDANFGNLGTSTYTRPSKRVTESRGQKEILGIQRSTVTPIIDESDLFENKASNSERETSSRRQRPFRPTNSNQQTPAIRLRPRHQSYQSVRTTAAPEDEYFQKEKQSQSNEALISQTAPTSRSKFRSADNDERSQANSREIVRNRQHSVENLSTFGPISPTITDEELGARKLDNRKESIDQPREHYGLSSSNRNFPVPTNENSRTQPRRLRGNIKNSPKIDGHVGEHINIPQENEVLKFQRTRGRQRVSAASTTIATVGVESLKPRNEITSTLLSTTSMPQETFHISSVAEINQVSTEGTTRNRFQLSKTRKLGSRPDTSVEVTSKPLRRKNMYDIGYSSRESTTPQSSSSEETKLPSRIRFNFPTTLTTEGFTDIVASTERIKNNSKEKEIEKVGPLSRKLPYRGHKKAELAIALKPVSDGEVSDEDNYPKEFLEKIKTSAEVATVVNRAQNGRSLPSVRNAARTLPKRHMDSDISESIHEDVFEQELPVAVKLKESNHYQRTKYFGKGKVSSTTATPLPTEKSELKTYTSSVDTLRQRYLDKLKRSQEERNQKIAKLRPKLTREGGVNEKALIKSAENAKENIASLGIAKPSAIPSRSTPHHQYRRTEKKKHSAEASAEQPNKIKFRPRFSPSSRFSQEAKAETVTPTVSEYSRTKNRFSRLRKEELSVEVPEAKFFTRGTSADSILNFINLRTKDLTPLGSEKFEESVSNNEILETLPTSTASTESSSNEMTTSPAAGQRDQTTQSLMVGTTTMTADVAMTTIKDENESNDVRFSQGDVTTEAPMAQTTEQDKALTTTPGTLDEKVETTVNAHQATISTRHRFSSRYVGSLENSTEEPTTGSTLLNLQENSTSTLSILTSFTSSPSTDLSNSSPSNSPVLITKLIEDTASVTDSVVSSSNTKSLSYTMPTSNSVTETASTSRVTPTTVSQTIKKQATKTAKKNEVKNSKTTAAPSFLDNRPILKNIVNLFSLTSTTTKKPKIKAKTVTTKRPSKSAKKAKKTTPKSKSTSAVPVTSPTTAKSITISSSTEPITSVNINTTRTTPTPANLLTSNSSASAGSNVTTVSPLPLAISAEEVINDTKEVINNKISFGNAFSISVPRTQLDALTPESFLNTTELPSTTPTTAKTMMLTTEAENITSQPVYFEYSTSSRPQDRVEIPKTTPTTTTAGDYYVFGIYPNNTVVKKRAWKTFDYEKYMSPYVIFGIYPNNTIVKKFPNGTVINDEFMTSDNEINAPQSTVKSTSLAAAAATTASSAGSSVSTEAETIPSSTEEMQSDTKDFAATDSSDLSNDEPTTQYNGRSGEISADFSEPSNFDESTDVSIDDDTTTEQMSTSTMEAFEIDPIFVRSGLGAEDTTVSPQSTSSLPETSTISTTDPSTVSSTPSNLFTTPMSSDETTVDPTLNLVLPLTIEEVQTFWNGNFSDNSNEINSNVSAIGNLIGTFGRENEPLSITSLAYQAISTSGTTNDPRETTTTFSLTSPPQEMTSRKPRVKFVTLTPGVVVSTDFQGDDAITMSSQHVQKVTKAPAQIPTDILTSVFGELEEKSSSPIPDILKDVGNEVEGDGLTAALARRIIALAMERAKSTTTDSVLMSTTTGPPPTTTMSSSLLTTIVTPRTTTRKKQSTRTVSNAATDASQQNTIISLPVGEDLQNVLQQLLAAQRLEPLTTTTVKAAAQTAEAPQDMEKVVENQIRLAEQVRKASRTMKKKKKKKKPPTTTPAPFRLGFLFNFFNRPSPAPAQSNRAPKRLQASTLSPSPTALAAASTAQILSSAPPDSPSGIEGIEESGADAANRGELLTAAIDVTKAVSKFMGTVINNAASSFQTFVRGNFWGR